jgi:hypothetical protein
MSKSPEEMIRDFPSDWWQQARAIEILIEWFKPFIVGLMVGGSVMGEFQYSLYTGFLLYHRDRLLWLTAGHVVDYLSQVLSSENFTLTVMRWLDDYKVPGAEAIPVNRPQLRMKSWTAEGLDFGAIVIPYLDAHSLLANQNVSVMEEGIWRNLKLASPEGYYVLGFPREWNDLKEIPVQDNKILRSIKADLACLPAQPISPPTDISDDAFWDKPGAFYGKLLEYPDNPNLKVENIKGMSGGPILSIERTENSQIAIRLVGIQSMWKPGVGVVRAEPIDAIATVLTEWI